MNTSSPNSPPVKKYFVEITRSVSHFSEVEASTIEEAYTKAKDMSCLLDLEMDFEDTGIQDDVYVTAYNNSGSI